MEPYTDSGRKQAIGALPSDESRNYARHARVLHEALDVVLHRSGSYGSVWQQYGALANLLQAARKVDRLMALWWHDRPVVGEEIALGKDALDDAMDAINYLAFFITMARDGSIIGEPPQRPVVPPDIFEVNRHEADH